MNARRRLVVVAAGFIGWALCFGVMGIGMAAMSLDNALIVHAVAAPIIFGVVSLVYFKRFGYTSPLATAAAFVGFVITMDFLLVALVINRSLAMFTSPIGTWIPFSLIFASTYLMGLYLTRRAGPVRNPAAATVSSTN